LQIQVFCVGVGLGTHANQENGFCESTDNDRLSEIVIQTHINIGREKILQIQAFRIVVGLWTRAN